jgi:hypothetical protein
MMSAQQYQQHMQQPFASAPPQQQQHHSQHAHHHPQQQHMQQQQQQRTMAPVHMQPSVSQHGVYLQHSPPQQQQPQFQQQQQEPQHVQFRQQQHYAPPPQQHAPPPQQQKPFMSAAPTSVLQKRPFDSEPSRPAPFYQSTQAPPIVTPMYSQHAPPQQHQQHQQHQPQHPSHQQHYHSQPQQQFGSNSSSSSSGGGGGGAFNGIAHNNGQRHETSRDVRTAFASPPHQQHHGSYAPRSPVRAPWRHAHNARDADSVHYSATSSYGAIGARTPAPTQQQQMPPSAYNAPPPTRAQRPGVLVQPRAGAAFDALRRW